MKPNYIKLEQSGAEWKRWRAQGIGSSAAPVIMFESVYDTPFKLFQKYMGLRAEKPENRFMNRGKRL